MNRGCLPQGALAVAAGVILLCAVATLGAAAVSPSLSEAPLNQNGEAYEVNAGAGGNVWISDYAAGEVWQVATDGSYTVYGGLSGVSDARPGAAGEVWFGSGDSCTLGRLSTTTPSATTWSLGTGCSPLATAYDGSRVWVADFANPRLYNFDGTNLCAFALPAGGAPNYLAVQAGQIWYGDSTNGAIVRLDPTPATPQATSWQLPAEAHPFGLAIDTDNTVWWTDPSLATVNHFEPGTNSLTTYALPAGSRPELLTLSGGSAWYSDDLAGAIGQVDPAVATGVETSLTSSPATVSRSCQAAPAGTPHAVSVRSGTLAWTSGSYVATTTNGVTSYQLAAGALPWGIAVADGNLLVADRGRQVLARLLPVDLKNKIYLPSCARP